MIARTALLVTKRVGQKCGLYRAIRLGVVATLQRSEHQNFRIALGTFYDQFVSTCFNPNISTIGCFALAVCPGSHVALHFVYCTSHETHTALDAYVGAAVPALAHEHCDNRRTLNVP